MLCFGTVKTVPVFMKWIIKCPCVLAFKLFDVNGLVCVEIDRLRH